MSSLTITSRLPAIISSGSQLTRHNYRITVLLTPGSSQLTHHAHHTRGQLRIKHHNNYTVWHQRGGDRIKTTITWMSDYRDLSTLCLIQTPQRAVVVDMWSYKNKENIGFAVISLIQWLKRLLYFEHWQIYRQTWVRRFAELIIFRELKIKMFI